MNNGHISWWFKIFLSILQKSILLRTRETDMQFFYKIKDLIGLRKNY